jgi:hypothetical protein
MKKSVMGSVIVLLVFFLSMGLGFAGNGKGGGNGVANGTGPIHDIYAGTPFIYVGEVIECQGGGMVIATETENVTVYGIGPIRYWDELGVVRPAVGDNVTVSGYAVDYNGVVRNMATTITFSNDEGTETVVDLRDPETGAPLWRQPYQH